MFDAISFDLCDPTMRLLDMMVVRAAPMPGQLGPIEMLPKPSLIVGPAGWSRG